MRCGPDCGGMISHEPRLSERLEVHAINAIGRRLYESYFGRPKIASRDVIQPLLAEAARDVDAQRFSRHFFTDRMGRGR